MNNNIVYPFSQAAERAPPPVNLSSQDPTGGASGASETAVPAGLEGFEVRGSRFSKSAGERQKMLHQRKEELLLRARRSDIIILTLLSAGAYSLTFTFDI